MTGVDFARPLIGAIPPGLVNAEWLFVKIITAGRIGSCAASHANIAKLTAAALAFQIIRVAQLLKNRGALPNLGERLLVQVTCQDRQVSAGINLASV